MKSQPERLRRFVIIPGKELKNMINKTTKRLLSASCLGICFAYGDGHRWINCYEDGPIGNINMYYMLSKHKLLSESFKKIYGNIIDCLDFVDSLLSKMSQKSLEKQFDDFQDWGFGEEFVNEQYPDWENSGTECW